MYKTKPPQVPFSPTVVQESSSFMGFDCDPFVGFFSSLANIEFGAMFVSSVSENDEIVEEICVSDINCHDIDAISFFALDVCACRVKSLVGPKTIW